MTTEPYEFSITKIVYNDDTSYRQVLRTLLKNCSLAVFLFFVVSDFANANQNPNQKLNFSKFD